MATDQVAVESQSAEKPGPHRRPTPAAGRSGGWGVGVVILLIVAGLGVGGYYMATTGKDAPHAASHSQPAGHSEGAKAAAVLPHVEVVKPRRGGIERTTNQPGTVRAFEFAELYAKVSGYVQELKVDRGSRVKKGDSLVELYVPELVAAVEQAQASLVRAKAGVEMASARVTTAEEKIKAALAYEKEAEARWRASVAQREYRHKQYDRISDLVARRAVEERLKDEERDRYDTAIADELAAQAGMETAKARVAEANAELVQAKADLKGAEAEVKVSQANLDKENALESYTHIKSPYDGVVIFRGEAVHKGAFIQSADQGMKEPMLTVARDEIMRTIIPVPDLDVPFAKLGDPAIVRIDALGNREFKGTVSRIADSEDINDRTMRVEIDLENPVVDPNGLTRVLRDGMYGRAEIILEKDTKNLTVPSSAIVDKNPSGDGTVEVVRDGKMYRQKVKVGRDSGIIAEILSGLDPDADVIVQPDVAMADGTPVQVGSSAVAEAPATTGSDHG
jgi:HlyD family secretion protein